jgi:hypothetical protein
VTSKQGAVYFYTRCFLYYLQNSQFHANLPLPPARPPPRLAVFSPSYLPILSAPRGLVPETGTASTVFNRRPCPLIVVARACLLPSKGKKEIDVRVSLPWLATFIVDVSTAKVGKAWLHTPPTFFFSLNSCSTPSLSGTASLLPVPRLFSRRGHVL